MCNIIDGLWDITLAPLVRELEQPTVQPAAGASIVGLAEIPPDGHLTVPRNGWLMGMGPIWMVQWLGCLRRNLEREVVQRGGEPAEEGRSGASETKPR